MGRLIEHAHKQAEGVPLRLDDVEGQEVLVTAADFTSGSFGPYMTLTVVNMDGEELDVMTGAKLVLDAMENAVAAGALPCEAKVVRRGRTWLVE